MNLVRKLYLFFLLFLNFSSFAQKIIILKDTTKEFVFNEDYYSVLEDSLNLLTIKDINQPHNQKRFKINKASYNERTSSTYWIKFSIIHKASIDNLFCLESYSPHTENITLYIEGLNSEWIERRNGEFVHFYDREIKNKNLIFNIPTDTINVRTYYLKIKSSNYCGFDFRIKSFSYFSNYNTNEYFFLGTYYGILFIMALYNLLMYFSIKEQVYIYYVLYVLSGIISTLTEDCLGYQYVWFKFPHWNTPIGYHIAPLFLLVSFVLYSRQFLQLKSLLPLHDKIILASTGIFLFYYGLHLSVLSEKFYFRGLYLIPFILIYISGIISFLNGYKPARFFIFGYTIIFVSIIIIQLRATGLINGNLLTVYSLNYGLVLEVAVLSFAMADRIKYIKKDKDDALRDKYEVQQKIIHQLKINEELNEKVNRELEEKVTLRTVELFEKNKQLEDANLKLQELSEKANQMSLKLDLDNWNLQKSIKESIKDRMFGKEVSYQEFNRIFSDESTCLRYLEELKWNDTFRCKKCGNVKYINGIKIFTRKCTKCGYSESVTANTLFHGLRFPISKAFYMTYLVHRNYKITLDELSELLELRRNTCWNFKKKVIKILEQDKKHSKKTIETWEDLIKHS